MNSQRRTSTGKNKKTGLEWNSFKFESNVLTRQFSRKFSSEFLNFVYQFFFIPNAKSNVPFYTGYQEWYNSFIERSIRASFVQILISAVFVFLAIFQFYSLSTSYLSPPRKGKGVENRQLGNFAVWQFIFIIKNSIYWSYPTNFIASMAVFMPPQFQPIFSMFHDNLLNFEHHITIWLISFSI